MLRIAVMVSGGGTNLQAIIDGIKDKTITNTEIAAVISNNADAYALTRAKDNGIEAICVSPKSYETSLTRLFLRRLIHLMLTLLFLQDFLLRFLKKWYISIHTELLIYIHHSYHHFAELVFMDFMSMRLHLQKA